MADVEQMKEIVVPFVTCEISCCQYVSNLVYGVNVPGLNLRIQVDCVNVKQVRTVVRGWSFGLILGALACLTWWDATGPPVLMNPWFYWIGLGNNGTLKKNQIPKIQSLDTIHP